MPGIVTVREMEATFNTTQRPFYEAVARKGQGVMETLQSISQLIIRELKGGET